MNLTRAFEIFGAILIIVRLVSGLRILGLFPIQIYSHFNIAEELMRALAEKGHKVDVYSHFPLKTPLKNYRDYSLQGSELIDVFNNVPYEVIVSLSKTLETSLKFFLEKHQEPLCNLLGHPSIQKLLHDPPQDPPYDVIVTEISIVHCFIPFGRHLNVPVVGLVPTRLMDWQYDSLGIPINLAVDRSFAYPATPPMTFTNRLFNFITYYRIVLAYSRIARKQDRYVEKYFGPGLPSTVDLLKDLSVVLIDYDQSMGVMPLAPKIIPIGGLHIVDRNETLPKPVQKWLDESTDGCIYFSFGSMAKLESFPRHIIEALYRTFENIAPIRVLLKIGKPEELPPGLPSNVLIQSWFQQTTVLRHKNIKAYVSHGGLKGSQEAIYYGVPMVVIPLFGDHFIISAKCVERNIAIKLEVSDITEESFTYAINEVLKNSFYRESVQRVKQQYRDRPVKPLDSAIFWIEYAHRNGKSALKLPIEDMPWWQASHLDVYAFLGGSVFISLWICKKLIEIFISACVSKAVMNLNRRKKIN